MITHVVLLSPDHEQTLSVQEFLALPLDKRIQLILEHAVTFYQDRTLIDRQDALKCLRTLKR